jgi:hypothetical protein
MLLTPCCNAVAPCTAEGGPPFGGYALSESNKVRLCKLEVPQSCLDVKSPDACVNQVGPAGTLLVSRCICYRAHFSGRSCMQGLPQHMQQALVGLEAAQPSAAAKSAHHLTVTSSHHACHAVFLC